MPSSLIWGHDINAIFLFILFSQATDDEVWREPKYWVFTDIWETHISARPFQFSLQSNKSQSIINHPSISCHHSFGQGKTVPILFIKFDDVFGIKGGFIGVYDERLIVLYALFSIEHRRTQIYAAARFSIFFEEVNRFSSEMFVLLEPAVSI